MDMFADTMPQELEAKLLNCGLVLERWTSQPNDFSRVAGALAACVLQILSKWPKFVAWVKVKSIESENRKRLEWKTDDVITSHEQGELLGIARRR